MDLTSGGVFGQCEGEGCGDEKYAYTVWEVVDDNTYNYNWISSNVGKFAVLDEDNWLVHLYNTLAEANTYRKAINKTLKNILLKYFADTGQLLCQLHYNEKVRQRGWKEKIKEEERQKDRWDELTATL